MKLVVTGLWHLGVVTAACLAAKGHTVLAFDDNIDAVARLKNGQLPVDEPGLSVLVQEQVTSGRLAFTSSRSDLSGFGLYWICYDTPVDQHDRADVESVVGKVLLLAPNIVNNATIVVSSQIPVGSTARLAGMFQNLISEYRVDFAYAPENLRLGRAIQAFLSPELTVVGVETKEVREYLLPLFQSLSSTTIWMSIESAEMTKHALNAYLAMTITFANEVAGICERVGADARDVERALRRDPRIGSAAYIRPGNAFDGATLARDVIYLQNAARTAGVPSLLLDGVWKSNENHRTWTRDVIKRVVQPIQGKRFAILGLTYKPGTDTLRRSSSVELCRWLSESGAVVCAFDPAVRVLPDDLRSVVTLRASAMAAVEQSDVAVVATAWPEFSQIRAEDLLDWTHDPVIIDPSGVLSAKVGLNPKIRYVSVGRAT